MINSFNSRTDSFKSFVSKYLTICIFILICFVGIHIKIKIKLMVYSYQSLVIQSCILIIKLIREVVYVRGERARRHHDVGHQLLQRLLGGGVQDTAATYLFVTLRKFTCRSTIGTFT